MGNTVHSASIGSTTVYHSEVDMSNLEHLGQTFGEKISVSRLERGSACHPERREGSLRRRARSFAALRMTGCLSKCLHGTEIFFSIMRYFMNTSTEDFPYGAPLPKDSLPISALH